MSKTEIVWMETKKIMKNNFRDNSIENRKIEILEIITNANCLFLRIKEDVVRKKFCVFLNYFIAPFVIPLTTHFWATV